VGRKSANGQKGIVNRRKYKKREERNKMPFPQIKKGAGQLYRPTRKRGGLQKTAHKSSKKVAKGEEPRKTNRTSLQQKVTFYTIRKKRKGGKKG